MPENRAMRKDMRHGGKRKVGRQTRVSKMGACMTKRKYKEFAFHREIEPEKKRIKKK